jgi:hypothetical protein
VNLKSGGMDPNALDVAVREGIMTYEQRIEDMRAIERRLKRKYPLMNPSANPPPTNWTGANHVPRPCEDRLEGRVRRIPLRDGRVTTCNARNFQFTLVC